MTNVTMALKIATVAGMAGGILLTILFLVVSYLNRNIESIEPYSIWDDWKLILIFSAFIWLVVFFNIIVIEKG